MASTLAHNPFRLFPGKLLQFQLHNYFDLSLLSFFFSLTIFVCNLQSYIVTHWDEHGGPALDLIIQKVLFLAYHTFLF
jgi:hypothetical protein